MGGGMESGWRGLVRAGWRGLARSEKETAKLHLVAGLLACLLGNECGSSL
jgi:hypothetical protein